MTDFNLPPLHALEIVVAPHLKGSKRAVRFGTEARVHVSPAMYELIRHANAEELKALMRAIEIVNLPPLPSIHDPLPMTTELPPGPDMDRAIRRGIMYGRGYGLS